jgi:hypothetical protein
MRWLNMHLLEVRQSLSRLDKSLPASADNTVKLAAKTGFPKPELPVADSTSPPPMPPIVTAKTVTVSPV